MALYYTATITLPDDGKAYGPAHHNNVMCTIIKHRNNEQWTYLHDPAEYAYHMCLGQIYVNMLESQLEQAHFAGANYEYFVQLEKGPQKKRWHLHIVVDISIGQPRKARELLETVERMYSNLAFGRTIRTLDINKERNGSWKIENEDFIINYLCKKIPVKGCTFAWTNIEREPIKSMCGNIEARLQQHENIDENIPMFKQASGEKLAKLVEFMIKNKITDEQRYLQKYEASFFSFYATVAGQTMFRNALQIAKSRIASDIPLGVWLAGFTSLNELIDKQVGVKSMELGNSKINEIMVQNSYNPIAAAYVIAAWSMGMTGRRRALWLYGDPQTGKSIIARAIATGAASFGCVNWTNENFPFQDIIGTCVAWWEEGRITEPIVEVTKALMAGGTIRVDRKCRDSVECKPPPFIITSNQDMTLVYSGNTISFEHQGALQDRMIQFKFTKRLPPDFGEITQDEINAYFKWAMYIYTNKLLPSEYKHWTNPTSIGFMIQKQSGVVHHTLVERIDHPFEEEEREALAELDSMFENDSDKENQDPEMELPPRKKKKALPVRKSASLLSVLFIYLNNILMIPSFLAPRKSNIGRR
ncbi:nonstructural protein [Roe deer copiparvovirus]|uniref:Nonstructural protein n=1 Tax=Roe deer copiparvovirus TaxID=2555547 RepID=A0A482ESR8_9VIRU|nr:nonstructural protein [Roe deer copiparvovirus]QBM79591.1 nonstructural protein [Roe deer copiparvovirus]